MKCPLTHTRAASGSLALMKRAAHHRIGKVYDLAGDNRPLLAAGKPELREHKAVYFQSDAEIGLFSDEVVVNCAP